MNGFEPGSGPVVRPYALTSGHSRPPAEFTLISVVLAVRPVAAEDTGLGTHCVSILRLCQAPQSVVDISSRLELPVGVVRVLLADLAERELIRDRVPTSLPALPDDDTFRTVINGIRAL